MPEQPEQPEKSVYIRRLLQHYLRFGIFSSLLFDFTRYIDGVAVDGVAKADNHDSEKKLSETLEIKQEQTKEWRIQKYLALFFLIVARAIDTALFIITTCAAMLVVKGERLKVGVDCCKNLYQGFKSIGHLLFDLYKGRTEPLGHYLYSKAKIKKIKRFDPATPERSVRWAGVKDFQYRKRLSRHQMLLLYRERPDLNLAGGLKKREPYMRLEKLSRYLFTDSITSTDSITRQVEVEKDFLTGKKLKNGVTANKLKKEGISAADLLMLGVLPESLLEAGFTQEQLDEKGRISVAHLLDIGVSTESLKKTGVSVKQLDRARFLRATRQTRYDIFENIRYSDAVETKLMNELKRCSIVVKDNEIEYEIRVDGDSLKLIQSPPLHNELLVYNFDLNSKRVVIRWAPEGEFKKGTLENRFESMEEFTQYVEFTHEKAIIESLLDKFSVFSNTVDQPDVGLTWVDFDEEDVDQPDDFTDGQKQFLSSISLTLATKNTVINEILLKGFVEGEGKSFGFSILFEDIKCGIRYRDQSLELIQFQDNDNLLVHTATNFDDVRSREVTTEEFKKNDTGEVLKFSSIDEFETFVNSDSSEFSQKLHQASIGLIETQFHQSAHSAVSRVHGAGGMNQQLEAALQEQKESKGENKYGNNPETEQNALGDH